MRVVYIAEGGKELGMGHIVHQAAVVEALKHRILEAKQDITIVDALVPPPVPPGKLVLMNCLHPKYEADVIVTPDVSPGFVNSKVSRLTKSGRRQVHFSGPRYWFLRPEFMEVVGARIYKHRPFVDVIGVMIGGTDPHGLTPLILKELHQYDVRVVQGDDVCSQMWNADLMVVGCGMGFWESLSVGTPAIPMVSNEAQVEQYGRSFKLGKLGELKQMTEAREWAEPDDRWQVGQGQEEVIEEILR